MSIEKRGTGYTVRWRDGTGRSRSQQVQLWRDAVTLDGDLKRKKAMGELIAHERGKERLCDFWELYWRNYAAPNLTPRTQETYRLLYTKHILRTIGHYRLRDITREHASSISSEMSKTLAPSTVRKVLALLQGVLQRAVEWGYLASNPVTGIKKPRLASREGMALSTLEVSRFKLELDHRGMAIVAVLAGTGMRPGELRALCWRDVTKGLVRIERAASSNAIGPTKTNRRRAVAVPASVDTDFLLWHMACGRPGPATLVFPGANGKLWTDNGYRLWQRNTFAPAAARAGLKGLRPYDLRHTYASQRIAEGADILRLASELGHAPTMTLTVYGHLLAAQVGAREVREPTANLLKH